MKDTKTHSARRLALDPETIGALRSRRDRAEMLAVMCRCDLASDAYVFGSSPDGSAPLHPDTVTGGFQRLCRRLGLSGIRLHDYPDLRVMPTSVCEPLRRRGIGLLMSA